LLLVTRGEVGKHYYFKSVVASKVRLQEEWGYQRSKVKLRKEWCCEKNVAKISLLEHILFFSYAVTKVLLLLFIFLQGCKRRQ
jgi:hypothetical protein